MHLTLVTVVYVSLSVSLSLSQRIPIESSLSMAARPSRVVIPTLPRSIKMAEPP
jgi:hypothetical protein